MAHARALDIELRLHARRRCVRNLQHYWQAHHGLRAPLLNGRLDPLLVDVLRAVFGDLAGGEPLLEGGVAAFRRRSGARHTGSTPRQQRRQPHNKINRP